VYLDRSGKWNIGGQDASKFISSRLAMLNKERILEVIAYLESQVIKPLVIPKGMFDPSRVVSIESEGVTLRIGYSLTPGYNPFSKTLSLDHHGKWDLKTLRGVSDLKTELSKFERIVFDWLHDFTSTPTPTSTPASTQILLQI
jgi:hypothetical protein